MTELVIDLYAGGGGASEGIQRGTEREVDVAINHDADAIRMHWTNHPRTIHLQSDVDAVDPRAVVGDGRVGLLWASPQCTHFSGARGGAPKSVQQREQGWSVVRWAREVSPRVVICENVKEWATWGPLHPETHPDPKLRGQPIKERAGETWNAWVQAFRDLGYTIEWRKLRACDYGAPTSRERLFVVARRDGLPIVWPEPTHGPGRAHPYRTTAECIDWSVPMLSIFATREEARAWAKAVGADGVPQRPLAEATQRRIAEGIRRFVLEAKRPFLVNLTHGGRLEPVDEPARTITAAHRGEKAVVAPLLARAHSHGWDANGSDLRGVDRPSWTVTAKDATALVAPVLVANNANNAPHAPTDPLGAITSGGRHLVASAVLVETGNGEREGQAPRVRDIEAPYWTITAQGSQGAVAAAWMVKHFGGPNGHTTPGGALDEPCSAVTARDHHAVGAVFLDKLHGSARAGQPLEAPAPTVTAGGGRGGGHAAMVAAFLTRFNGRSVGGALDQPAPTSPAHAHDGLVTVTIDGELYTIVDIAMRMLTPEELKLCQGFDRSYVLTGTKSAQVARIGNSVSPHPAAALARANFGPAPEARKRRKSRPSAPLFGEMVAK